MRTVSRTFCAPYYFCLSRMRVHYTSSVKKLESLTQARFFGLHSLREINTVQNISKLTFVNIDSLSIRQHWFDNINKQNT